MKLVDVVVIGEDVYGALYTAEQGHVNPLKLLTALRCAFQKKGGVFHGGQSVGKIFPKKAELITLDGQPTALHGGMNVAAALFGIWVFFFNVDICHF